MQPLNLIWVAKFKDDSFIQQFEEDKEHLFKEVQDRFSELKSFSLIHNHKDFVATVDLEKGIIYCNLFQPIIAEEFQGLKNNLRLIYFRRRRLEYTSDFKKVNTSILYFLGFQYNDEFGKNRKIMIQLDQDGNIIFGDVRTT